MTTQQQTATAVDGAVIRNPKLAAAFATARAEQRSVLVGYLPAGFPTIAASARMVQGLIDGGADAVEVGLPHSDPVLDGPVIQTADDIALRQGIRIRDVLAIVGEAAAANPTVPVLVMTYWNPVDRYGATRFAADLAAAGGAGCILPDLPVEEAGEWLAAAEQHALDTVFVVAPSSTDERLATITAKGTGFVYAAAVMGVTGTRTQVGEQAEDLVKRTRATTALPVCVGLGVSTAAQAAEVAAFADGAIVGSAFVKGILAAGTEDAAYAEVRDLAAELATGVR